MKRSCSNHRTNGRKENKPKGVFSGSNWEGHRCQEKNNENPVNYFFLKVCYLDCAKFDGLLESLYTIVKKSLPKCIFFELQPGSDSRISISVATWNG